MRLCHCRALAGLAGLICALLSSAAFAVSGCDLGSSAGGCVDGWFSVYKDATAWELTIKDVAADGKCAYAKVIIDRNNKDDKETRSPNVCGKDKTRAFRGHMQYSGTRGARLEVCIDRNNQPDSCKRIYYEYEIGG